MDTVPTRYDLLRQIVVLAALKRTIYTFLGLILATLLNNTIFLVKIAGMHMKMTESSTESELRMEIIELYKRLDRLECKWDALIRRLEGVARHPEDEGWFD